MALLFAVISLNVSAYDFEVDGIYYYITSYREMTVNVTSGDEKYSGDITIPSSVSYDGKDYIVTSIGSSAFEDCTSLTSITISDGVTSINGDAFEDCTSLTSVTIGKGLTSIESEAFKGCTDLTSINIPDGVTRIALCAFYDCSSLTSITIPDGVTSIEYEVFYGCSSLASITIGDGVTSIEYEAFRGCSGLTSITIPESVTSIGGWAFYGCSNLTSITIPDGVTSINNSTFYGCSGLTSLTIGAGVTSIGREAFRGCSGLTSITIPDSVISIDDNAFWGCSGLTSLTIGAGVTSIGESVFRDCSKLTSITIPNNVTSIDSGTFWGCSSLTSITFGSGITSIGAWDFAYCTSLTSITIPESITSIGNNAFSGCSGLTSIYSYITTPFSTTDEIFDFDVFYNSTLYVPKGTKSAYESTNYWSRFKNIVEMVEYVQLSVQASSGGSVSFNDTTFTNETREFSIEEDSDAILTFFPNEGYYLSSLTLNGTDVTSKVSNNSYTISNITAATTVVAKFSQYTYTLSVQGSSGGSVSYGSTSWTNATKTFDIIYGSDATLTFTPNRGYYLSALTVNGTDVTSKVSNNSYTISSITANTTVIATFSAIPVTTYTLSIQSGSGGTVSYKGSTFTNQTSNFTVDEGSSATLTFTPNTGYYLSSLTVNGTDVTSKVSNNSYTISNITAATTVVAKFSQYTYTLSVQGSSGGSVSYGSTSWTNATKTFDITYGSNATLKFTPSDGYYLSALTVDGTDVTSKVANNSYTISSIKANTSVVVSFSTVPITTYSVSIQSGSGGSVSYGGTTWTNLTKNFTVNEGSDATLTFTPNEGYYLSSLTVNGTDVTSKVSNNSYTVSNISAATTVVAMFSQYTYTLNIKASSGGNVSYSSTSWTNSTKTYNITYGSDATLTFTPNSGYYLSSLTVNGTDVTSKVSNNSYTVSNITANTTVVATFSEIPVTTYTLTVSAGANGNVSCNGTTWTNSINSFTVEAGSQIALAFSPNSGYYLSSLSVNGEDVTSSVANNTYTLSNITANTSVVATFAAIPVTTYSLSIQSGSGGTITYDGSEWTNSTKTYTLDAGTAVTISLKANTGYYLSSLIVNGTDVTSSVVNNTYTISSITANTSIIATYKLQTYSVALTVGKKGSVSYNGGSAVSGTTATYIAEHGSQAVLTITPNTGYRLKSLTVNGEEVPVSEVAETYTIRDITAALTISVEFEEIPATTYTLSLTSDANGSISYGEQKVSGGTSSLSVAEGTNAVITISANEGYRLKSLTVDGTDVTSSVVNNSYTISNITANTTVSAVFTQIITDISANGINYSVISEDAATLTVTSANIKGEVTIPETLTYGGKIWTVVALGDKALANNPELLSISIPATVTSVGDDILDGCTGIAAIIWNPARPMTGDMYNNTNPNLLQYVTMKKYATYGINNVVVNGVADNIELTDASEGNNFYCPVAFKAQQITYTHNYSMTTGRGTCQGWESIVLPFDVQTISRYDMKEAVPFAVWNSTSSSTYPFWLYSFSGSGWVKASSISANTPYIISMPNNDAYDDEYILTGEISFKASNAEVKASKDMVSSTNGDKTFIPALQEVAAADGVYPLNVNNSIETYAGKEAEGSAFISGLRKVHPFEAYMTTTSGGAKGTVIPLFDSTSGIILKDVSGFSGSRSFVGGNEEVYTIQGIRLGKYSDIADKLPAGVYVVNGKKISVKSEY